MTETQPVHHANAENTVFIGKKGTMAYVLAVITQMNQGKKEVLVKARGKSISKAVDVAEIVKNKMPGETSIHAINTTTEEVTSKDGKDLKVSAIEIKLKKSGNTLFETQRPMPQDHQTSDEASEM